LLNAGTAIVLALFSYTNLTGQQRCALLLLCWYLLGWTVCCRSRGLLMFVFASDALLHATKYAPLGAARADSSDSGDDGVF
jgi:hypothetical protein